MIPMVPAPHRTLLSALAVCLCAACTPASRVLLLPQEGVKSAVTVTTSAANAELTTPYAVAEIGRKGELEQALSSEAAVRERYPVLLALQPPPPQSFTLNFKPGTSELTPESLAGLDAIMAAARTRSGGEIVIVGHTDRQGAADANDALSLRRANAIRDVLVSRGFKAELINPVGRGEREPVVPTEDDVPEPRNRRAELIVR
jgi:outer membrane protein OmpA-like peptidoglycan-associated protein